MTIAVFVEYIFSEGGSLQKNPNHDGWQRTARHRYQPPRMNLPTGKLSQTRIRYFYEECLPFYVLNLNFLVLLNHAISRKL